MLKPKIQFRQTPIPAPAAFGRLRVETEYSYVHDGHTYPAAFGRLRVETFARQIAQRVIAPAAFGRLRVETLL